MADEHMSVNINNEFSGHSAAAAETAAGSNGATPKQGSIHTVQPPPFGQPTPNEEGQSPDRKRNLAHDTLPEDGRWENAGTKKSRREEARSSMDIGDINNGPEVGQIIPIKIKFTGPAIEKNLIYDTPTVTNLLQSSLFAGTYEGTGRKITSKHELILNITSITLIPDLLNVTCLKEGQVEWPIEVSVPINENECVFGVIKLHPSIPDDRIKEVLERNANSNSQHGKVVTEVFRIINKHDRNEYPTWTVRLKFKGRNRPQTIFYGDESIKVQPYYQKLVMCAKCSKAGHIAAKCQNTYRCGICGRGHPKDKCPHKVNSLTNKNLKRCPNCSLNHNANYGGCNYIIVEKEVIKIHAETNESKTNIRRHLWQQISVNGRLPKNRNPVQTGNRNFQRNDDDFPGLTNPTQNSPQSQDNQNHPQTPLQAPQTPPSPPSPPQNNQNQNGTTVRKWNHTPRQIQTSNRSTKPTPMGQNLNHNPRNEKPPQFNQNDNPNQKTEKAANKKENVPVNVISNEIIKLQEANKKQTENIITLLAMFCDLITEEIEPSEKKKKFKNVATLLFGNSLELEKIFLPENNSDDNMETVVITLNNPEQNLTHFAPARTNVNNNTTNLSTNKNGL